MGYARPKNAKKRKAVNKYTPEGRKLIHKNLQIGKDTMLWVTGKVMVPHDIHCHHKVPVSKGGTDEYANLILICKDVYTILHASQSPTIERVLNFLNLEPKQLSNQNKLRILTEMPPNLRT